MQKNSTEKEIEFVIGEAFTQKLMAAFGGMELCVYECGLSFRRISAVIGIEAAEKFCAHFNGERLYVPNPKRIEINERNRQIIQEYESGKSSDQLAFTHGLTRRQITNILKKSS